MANVFEPDFDDLRERPGFKARRARVGRQAGAERLGLSLWEVAPGEAAYPYHFHLGEEEALVILEGRPVLREPEGETELRPGDVLSFRRGAEGAHQLINRTDSAVRFLAVSTNGDPDIVVYPDSNKVGVAERPPHGGGLRQFFPLGAAVGYWEGERPPEPGLG